MWTFGRGRLVNEGSAIRARFLAVGVVALVLCGCVERYEATPLDIACCEGGVEVEVQLLDPDRAIAIDWSGTLVRESPMPDGHWQIADGVISTVGEACAPVQINGYVAACPPRDGLRAGRWAIAVNVRRDDGAGNMVPIENSPFECEIEIADMLVNFGGQIELDAARRTRMRFMEGSQVSNVCSPPQRSEATPIALYDFEEGAGSVVHNKMGDDSLNLTIADTAAVDWQPGYLVVSAPTLIATDDDALSLVAALQATNTMTVEAWVRPAKEDQAPPEDPQAAPARIVTLSEDWFHADFMLGQRAGFFIMRLRTAGDPGGDPERNTPEGTASTTLRHLVGTYDDNGDIAVYVNGVKYDHLGAGGDFSGWEPYRLALANEFVGERSWLGEYHLVAIYDQALEPDVVYDHFLVGPYVD